MGPTVIHGKRLILISSTSRGGGKTFELAKWAKEDKNRRIVVLNEGMRAWMAHEYGPDLKKEQIVSLDEVKKGVLLGVKEVGIDNADDILAHLLGLPYSVKAVTVTT